MKKTPLLIFEFNNDSNQPAPRRSLIRVFCQHEETLHPWQSNICPVKILIRLHVGQADLSCCRAHMSKGMFSNVVALFTLVFCKYLLFQDVMLFSHSLLLSHFYCLLYIFLYGTSKGKIHFIINIFQSKRIRKPNSLNIQ